MVLCSFKFHCDSINIAGQNIKGITIEIFKFHCDSINILMSVAKKADEENLNSTVILLIYQGHFRQ